MVELVYPADDLAPLLPVPTADLARDAAALKVPRSHSRKKISREIFPVIQENGFVIGRASREDCHNGSHLLHPVVHLHIIDRNQRLYIQKRSMKKDLLPGKWDTAVGGHVKYGERIVEALYREAAEEIGPRDFNPIYIDTYVWETERDREHVNVFAIVGSYDLHPDHDEVEDGKWWTMNKIEANLDSDMFTVNFVTEFQRIKKQLLALL